MRLYNLYERVYAKESTANPLSIGVLYGLYKGIHMHQCTGSLLSMRDLIVFLDCRVA